MEEEEDGVMDDEKNTEIAEEKGLRKLARERRARRRKLSAAFAECRIAITEMKEVQGGESSLLGPGERTDTKAAEVGMQGQDLSEQQQRLEMARQRQTTLALFRQKRSDQKEKTAKNMVDMERAKANAQRMKCERDLNKERKGEMKRMRYKKGAASHLWDLPVEVSCGCPFRREINITDMPYRIDRSLRCRFPFSASRCRVRMEASRLPIKEQRSRLLKLAALPGQNDERGANVSLRRLMPSTFTCQC